MSVKNAVRGLIGWIFGKPEAEFIEGVKKGATVDFGFGAGAGFVLRTTEAGVWFDIEWGPNNPEFYSWHDLVCLDVEVIWPAP